jgi:flagella basal body P-ring formation protein FlgA
MIRLLALLVALAAPAAAQTGPTALRATAPALKASVTVAGDLVRIGDLVENAGPVANVPIFRSPDLGTTGAVTTERVVEAIRPHELIDIETGGLSEVIVTRASRAIPRQDIASRIAQALAGQYGLGEPQNIAVTFDREMTALHVEPNAVGEPSVARASYIARTARFDVTLDLPAGSLARRHTLRLTGRAFETVATVTVNRPVELGQVLKASDLLAQRRPKAEANGKVIAELDAAIGLAARHALRPDQPLRESDLMKPEIVQRGDVVTIVYQVPGLVLTLRGKAQESGALGDQISVLNEQSKRLVQGTVTGPGRVTITALTTRLAEGATTSAPASAMVHGRRAE